jgi:uncharacterized repeat protein (TIGR01451 family)
MLARICRALILSFLLGGSALCHGMWAAQAPPSLTASAARQMEAIVGIKASKSAVQGKIDSRLFLGLLHRRGDPRLAPLTDFRFVAPEADGRVPIDVVTMPGGVKAVVEKLASLGAEVAAMSHSYHGGLTTIFDASTDVQDGAGGDDFPIEFIGGKRLLIDRASAGTTSSVPMLNLIVVRGELDDSLATSGATRGHSAAASAFSVAATPAAASFDGVSAAGPYPALFNAGNESESFTLDGPRRLLLGLTGAELTPGNCTATGGVVRQKPDFTAADGVSTAAGGLNPFYGTSAAAAHAAALAALLKSLFPFSGPAEIRILLVASAIDVEAPGIDHDTGAGILTAGLFGPLQVFLTAGDPAPTQVTGDGDPFVETYETWSLTVPLTNQFGIDSPPAAATAITAVLTTSTPGVTIGSPASAYPDLAPGATASNLSPYVFTVTGAFPCGATLHFTLTVTYSGGPSPLSFDLSLRTGAPGTPVTFSYTGPPVPIPDGADQSGTAPGAPAAATLNIPGFPERVYDVDLRIDGTSCSATAGSPTVGIDHSFISDLELTLIAPDGTLVKVIDNTDGGGNNLCQTRLDDESAGPSIQSVVTANAPFTGNFTPASPLSAFDGAPVNGDWRLQAQDFFNQDTGNIRAWSLIVTPAVCSDIGPPPVFVTATKTVAGTFFPGGTVTYTVILANSGNAPQADNPGAEFTDTLPAGLSAGAVTASSGMVSAAGNVVTWNGSIPAGGSVSITITATLHASGEVSNQGAIAFDADGDGTNETSGVTDNPFTAEPNDPTTFFISDPDPGIPTLSAPGLAALLLALAGAALKLLRRRRAS